MRDVQLVRRCPASFGAVVRFGCWIGQAVAHRREPHCPHESESVRASTLSRAGKVTEKRKPQSRQCRVIRIRRS